ncbi:MAG: TVP38/TMEM64 family protein [Asgard group archaeon]|nr:TVP38/TMEM64 family protein [Asgard group archaeon]
MSLNEDNETTKTNSELEQSANDVSRDFEVVEDKPPLKRFWQWMTKDKERLGSIIFILLFIVLIIVLAALNLNMGQIMQNIVDWFETSVGAWGIFLGIFVISIFGNFTIIFPVPYTLALVTIATRDGTTWWYILLMGIVAGAGASIGEASAWLLGRASKKVVEESMEKQVSRAQNWIDKGLAPLIIFLFAATPLPDDAILVFIGLLGYSLWKTLIWCFFGKIILTAGTGLAAKFLAGTPFGAKILWAFGLTATGEVDVPPPAWESAIIWIGTMILIGALLFIDWREFWNWLTRSTQKGKYKKLVELEPSYATTSTSNELTESKAYDSKQIKMQKKASFWQCVIKVKEDDYPDYFDFYTLSYILGQQSNIKLKADWFDNLNKNISDEKFESVNQYKIEKFILPKKLTENYQEEEALDDFLNKLIFVKLNINHPVTNKQYKIGMLLEKTVQNELNVRCLGEREALTIRSIKSIPSNLIVSELLNTIDSINEQPGIVEEVSYAFYEPPIEEIVEEIDDIIDGKMDEN